MAPYGRSLTDLGVGLLDKQFLYLGDDRRAVLPGVGVAVDRDTEMASLAAAQAYTCEDAARASSQGDVFDQYSDHALAFPIRGCGIVLHVRGVGRESQDPPAGVVTDGEAVLGTAPVALLFGFAATSRYLAPGLWRAAAPRRLPDNAAPWRPKRRIGPSPTRQTSTLQRRSLIVLEARPYGASRRHLNIPKGRRNTATRGAATLRTPRLPLVNQMARWTSSRIRRCGKNRHSVTFSLAGHLN